ncbi:MAG: alginate O-acetyltransferase AlgF [Rhodobacteraceae bacterium]|nr:alginate O-acetyltransferase AlgF [Paracoccaceae bacterium]
MMRHLFVLILLSFSFGGVPVSAQEEALYDAPVPDDAAFVRFIGVDAPTTVFGIDVSGDGLSSPAYRVVRATGLDGAEAGASYTVLGGQPDGTTLFQEPARDPARVMLALVNLTNADITLKTADGSIDIIGATGPRQMGFREINPVQVPVAVHAGDAQLGDVIPLSLRRGQNPALVVTVDGVELIQSELISEPLN